MNQEQLQKFCAPRDCDLHGLSKPIRSNGFIYATDRAILIRIEDDPAIECIDNHAKLPNMQSLVERKLALSHYKPLHLTLPPAETCGACAGHGHVEKCAICDGEGEFTKGRDTYECKACGGCGNFPDPNGTDNCLECNGTGRYRYQRIVTEGATAFSRHYLQLLLQLPEIELALDDQDPTNGFAGFRFAGGVGVLGPLR